MVGIVRFFVAVINGSRWPLYCSCAVHWVLFWNTINYGCRHFTVTISRLISWGNWQPIPPTRYTFALDKFVWWSLSRSEDFQHLLQLPYPFPQTCQMCKNYKWNVSEPFNSSARGYQQSGTRKLLNSWPKIQELNRVNTQMAVNDLWNRPYLVAWNQT